MAWIYKGKKYTNEELAGIIPECYTREDYLAYVNTEPWFTDDERKEIEVDIEPWYQVMIEEIATDMINESDDIYEYGIEYVE